MILHAGHVYKCKRESDSDKSVIIDGGSVNFHFGNSSDDVKTLASNKDFNLFPEVDNPYTNESLVLWPLYDYMAFEIVSGSPTVLIADDSVSFVGHQEIFRTT